MINFSLIQQRFRVAIGFTIAIILVTVSPLAKADDPTPSLVDAKKLEYILAGKNEFPRAHRMKAFESEGEIVAVGRLVTIDRMVYFKTTDQSYIPKAGRFPYPELLFELHLSEEYAYEPLIRQGIVDNQRVLYDGPIRIEGNWAYEGPYHIFGVVWVDAVTKVSASPEGNWQPWLNSQNKPGNATNKPAIVK